MLQNNNNPFDSVEFNHNEIIAMPEAEPIDWNALGRKFYLTGTPITAEELVDKKFDILRAKKFESSFEGQESAWYCIVRPVDQDETFAVVLGGQAVVDVLEILAQHDINRPVRVTLRFHEGKGKFKGYYTFE